VALINLNQNRDVVVSLRVPGRSEAATLVRLRAPALNSRNGLTLGGLTWDGSVDGQSLGTATSEPVTYDTGSYRVNLPALEAVVVTVAPAP
jgi:Glycosyl hydrolase family 79 C-terminal beta domain